MKHLRFYTFAFLLFPMLSFAQWTSNATLSQSRYHLRAATSGDKVIFAGGSTGGGFAPSNKVDILNTSSNHWSNTTLPGGGASLPGVVAAENKIYVAGGVNFNSTIERVAIDIYDISDSTWSLSQLSEPRFWVAAAAANGKVIFAGGGDITSLQTLNTIQSTTVDLYDIEADTWSVAQLSEARLGASALAIGDKIYIAGGFVSFSGLTFSKRIDIYDTNTGLWTIDSLSQARGEMAAFYSGGKAVFAGGYSEGDVSSDVVDILDVATGTWSIEHLSKARGSISGGVVCDKIYFCGGAQLSNNYITMSESRVDIYDPATGVWSTDELLLKTAESASAVAGNTLYVAGGFDPNSGTLNEVQEYTCLSTGLTPVSNVPLLGITPNPANENISVDFSGQIIDNQIINIEIFDMSGHSVAIFEYCKNNDILPINKLLPGIYVVKASSENENFTGRFLKIGW